VRTQNLKMTHGDDETFDVVVTNEKTGAAMPITGCSFWFTAKSALTDADPGVFQLKSPSDGVAIVDEPSGTLTVTVPRAATAGLPYEQTVLEYDFQMKDASANVKTVTRGTLTIDPDVTRVTT